MNMVKKKIVKRKKKNDMVVLNQKNIIKSLEHEIDTDIQTVLKNKVKNKLKQIRKTKKILSMQEIDLQDILTGKKNFSESDLLFEDSEEW